LSEQAKSLISRLLLLDAERRLSLDEILLHPFINHGGSIPKYLPLSTLACPPSLAYIKQHQPKGNFFPGHDASNRERFLDTVPVPQIKDKSKSKSRSSRGDKK